MKVILTEEQFKDLKDFYLMEDIMLNESLSLKNIYNKCKAALVAGVAVTAILFYIDKLNIMDKDKESLKNAIRTEAIIDKPQDTNFEQKVESVKKYIEVALKNQGYSIENLKLSPEAIVKACYENGFDLPLCLAQAHLESCFGMTNRARKTNSVWSVGSYDNGKNKATYKTQDDSIVPYINLMKNNYLGNKSIGDILTPGSFVDFKGNRYASDVNYENKVKKLRNKIISKYPELAS